MQIKAKDGEIFLYKDLGSRMMHSGDWTYKFEKELKRLNYNKGGW